MSERRSTNVSGHLDSIHWPNLALWVEGIEFTTFFAAVLLFAAEIILLGVFTIANLGAREKGSE